MWRRNLHSLYGQVTDTMAHTQACSMEERILLLLAKKGPLTKREIYKGINGLDSNQAGSILKGMEQAELVSMVAVIAISSWHVGNYMATFDGWRMATIMGATLGFCNFLMAHNIFKPHSTSRFASICGLIFFAVTSTYMQYTYFDANPDIGKTMVWNVNWDAFALGVWAPAAEILLGWIYAAGLRGSVQPRLNRPTASRFERIGEALASRIERRLNDEGPTSRPAKHLDSHESKSYLNGTQKSAFDNMDRHGGHGRSIGERDEQGVDVQVVPTKRSQLSKEAALERIQQIYQAKPEASYAEIAVAIGRSKATVANYVRELKQAQSVGDRVDGIRGGDGG